MSLPSPVPDRDNQYTAVFCRTLYDYQSNDDAFLSFHKGEIIEVMTRLESGWWDGVLGEERGWFPSNYVSLISKEEAGVSLAETEVLSSPNDSPDRDARPSATLPSALALARDDHSNWLQRDRAHAEVYEGGLDELATASMGSTSAVQSGDFWMPHLDPSGKIFYINMRTGEHSQELPTDADDEPQDVDFQPPAPSLSRSTSASREVYGRINVPPDSPVNAGFGLPRHTGTPEPWVRRLADDGLSYYYLNKIDGTVRWTRPEGNSMSRAASIPRSSPPAPVRQPRRRGSSSVFARSRGGSVDAYSDDSDIDPLDSPLAKYAPKPSVTRPAARRQMSSPAASSPTASAPSDRMSAEEAARSLQSALTPPPPESFTELAQDACEAIGAVTTLFLNRQILRADDHETLQTRVLDVVAAVRNLLLMSYRPYGDISSALCSRDALENLPSGSWTESHPQLKLAQRHVSAALSKVVLAAVSAQRDVSLFSPEAAARMATDAQELRRAIEVFVLEVQRADTALPPANRKLGKRRLFGALLPTNVGPGLLGAGAAAMWKGFGWVKHPEGEGPSQTLPDGVMADLRRHFAVLDGAISTLLLSLSADIVEVSRVRESTSASLTSLQDFLRLVSSIDLSQTVDADGKMVTDGVCMQNVHKVNMLVRTVEAAVQALYDDGALLLTTLQYFPRQQLMVGRDNVSKIVVMLRANIDLVFATFESLLHVGEEEVNKSPGSHHDSILWRTSRLLSPEASVSQSLDCMRDMEDDMEDVVSDVDEMIGLDFAIMKPKPKLQLTMPPAEPSLPPVPPLPPNLSKKKSDLNTSAREISADVGHNGENFLFEDDDDLISNPPSSKSLGSAKPPISANKILWVLGDVPPLVRNTCEIGPSGKLEELPWYLRPSYNPQDILIDPDGTVRGGTIPALVERLTAHEHGASPSYSRTFLMTFKSFTDLDTLFDLLVQRLFIQPPSGLTATELKDWKVRKQNIIQTRVLNTFKSMIQDENILEKEDMRILDKIAELMAHKQICQISAAKNVMTLIDRARSGHNARARTMTMSLDPPPSPIIPRAKAKIKLLDFDPIECARQLTIIECALFMKIKASECLARSREKKVANDNITVAIATTNKIAHWISDAVLTKEDPRKRALVVKHFIGIADRCRELHNFSTMIAIVSGLNQPHIRRLKHTWEQINQKFLSVLRTCEMTIDSQKNFSQYRQLLQRITPPCVPFLGVYLTTLTFIQDGAPNNLPGDLVNFRKRGKAAEVIQEIQKWQSRPFNFQRVDPIFDYIQQQLNKFDDTPDINDFFWTLSLDLEPRESEDEQMARLLQETGFL
ncbi:ras guanine nucleotide exchange factor domain-containing protein [Vararia minispora EC-137]|uniref:Ras guanine nucleotide exchange factor domain-containing protein n=1 Tax=Vararia minispora EC-137 TaxID=1314806 RepID=A0ACB8QY21_9AGAM|nr:ras guanine nucleotide exchange factor domain-containing protein [Vararia minispora EC-137]